MALGSEVESYVKNLGLKTNKWGNIAVNENYQTSNPKIYAGGDLVETKSSVARAMATGKKVAQAIIDSIK